MPVCWFTRPLSRWAAGQLLGGSHIPRAGRGSPDPATARPRAGRGSPDPATARPRAGRGSPDPAACTTEGLLGRAGLLSPAAALPQDRAERHVVLGLARRRAVARRRRAPEVTEKRTPWHGSESVP